MERLILECAVASRKAFQAAAATLPAADLSQSGQAIWAVLSEYYERDRKDSVDRDLLARLVEQRYPGHKELVDLVHSFDQAPPAHNLAEHLFEMRKQSLREKMSIALLDRDDEEYEDLAREYRALAEELDGVRVDEFIGTEPESLLDLVDAGNRIPLGPPGLCERLKGGLLPGHNALFFARPEVGKSLWAINSAVAAARAGYRVGYWENEEPVATTQLRTVQCICGYTEADVRVRTQHIRDRLEEAGYYDRLVFRESPAGHLNEIDRWVEKQELDLVIINQLPNLQVKPDNRVLELSALARGARSLAKSQGCAVLSIAQAGDSANDERILKMGDLEWSNTAVQATLDLMAGMGVDDELNAINKRCIALIKNKVGRSHENFLVSVDTSRNVIE